MTLNDVIRYLQMHAEKYGNKEVGIAIPDRYDEHTAKVTEVSISKGDFGLLQIDFTTDEDEV